MMAASSRGFALAGLCYGSATGSAVDYNAQEILKFEDHAVIRESFANNRMVWGHPTCHMHRWFVSYEICCTKWFGSSEGLNQCFDYDQPISPTANMSYENCCFFGQTDIVPETQERYNTPALAYPPSEVYDGCTDPL